MSTQQPVRQPPNRISIKTFMPEDSGTPPELSFEAHRKFLQRLERELEAAERAGYNYLTVFGPDLDSGQFYYSMAVQANFVPHNLSEDLFREPLRGSMHTFPVAAGPRE